MSVSLVKPIPLAAAVSSPTRLRLPDLLHVTDRYAEAVLDGRFEHVLPTDGLPTDRRWHTRLHAEDDLDVWLISWVSGHTTELHDHAGSLGALTVLTGALREYRWDGAQLRTRGFNAGDQAAFPLGWVHDVVCLPGNPGRLGDSGTTSPLERSDAISVHAYSPPLTAMSYYEVTARQTLRRTRTELTTR